jgi:hypothetical protein
MTIAKCKNCGFIMINDPGAPTLWTHRRTGQELVSCSNTEPGMDLPEVVAVYFKNPRIYATWAFKENPYTCVPGDMEYTENAILHGLRMQATIHWNNCTIEKCNRCRDVGRDTANTYMKGLAKGRHDLHPHDDDEVFRLAFRIHDTAGHGKPGIMTPSYTPGTSSNSHCDCYERGYELWLPNKKAKITDTSIIYNTEDDYFFEPRLD